MLSTHHRFFSGYLADDASKCSSPVNNRTYEFPYWLADGIYPDYRCFVKTFHEPAGDEQKLFAKAQEAVRKDVERAFGVLQARFAIVARPARHWKLDELNSILRCCIIPHNMIVADDRETGCRAIPARFAYYSGPICDKAHRIQGAHFQANDNIGDNFTEIYADLVGSSAEHFSLKVDLVQQHWREHNLLLHGHN